LAKQRNPAMQSVGVDGGQEVNLSELGRKKGGIRKREEERLIEPKPLNAEGWDCMETMRSEEEISVWGETINQIIGSFRCP